MDEIMRALRQYEREPGTKKAVLLTQNGGYYLYDGRFCAISDFELCVTGEKLHIQGTSVPCGLFFGVVDSGLRWSVGERGAFLPERLSLIFHIALGDTEELLRGIPFAQGEGRTCLSSPTRTRRLCTGQSRSAHRQKSRHLRQFRTSWSAWQRTAPGMTCTG